MELRGRSVLVTGASRGLGRALALEIASRGARVVLVARGAEALERVAVEIRERGGEAWAIAADVGDAGAAASIAAQAAASAGAIDVVIHDASTLGDVPLPLLADARPIDVARTFEVNVLGPFRLTRVLLGPMMLRRSGLIVTISSDAAVEAYPRWGAYGASKAALDHMTRIWAAELAGSGVRAIAIDPGEMDTEMHAAALPDADRATLADPAGVARRIARAIERGVSSGERLVVSALGEEAAA